MGLFDRSNKKSLNKKANKLFNQNKYMEALECYNELLEIDSNYIKAWYGKGIIFHELKSMKML